VEMKWTRGRGGAAYAAGERLHRWMRRVSRYGDCMTDWRRE
jgi:hypothetical protein